MQDKQKFSPSARAVELFNEHQREICERTDRMFAVLMAIQWAGGLVAAYIISPRAWVGSASQVHLHIWAALLLGGAISSLPIALAVFRPGQVATRYTIAVGQMLMGALLIHLTGGRIETHFHVFGSLAFLSFYRDWRVLVPATVVVAADHMLRGFFWPQSVYGVVAASDWRWIEHAGWVLFEDTFLLIAIKRSVSEMWDIAERTAERESLTEDLEGDVSQRTAQLAAVDNRRKELEDQLRQSQKLEAIGQLAGGVAHDFNNLLTVIAGQSDMCLRVLKPEDPLHRRIEQIKKAEDRAAALTRQLLAFSRKQILQPKIMDLNSIVVDMNKMLQRLIGEHINLMLGLGADLGKVKADPNQVEQVLMNLAVNARDAMPKGGKLTIETSNVQVGKEFASHHISVPPGPYVMLAVSDTGCGMDAATQARIFEPFFTTKELGKGTGLGLSTVYGIVKQSGGTIWVYSEVGHGTTFKIYLPIAGEAAEQQQASAAAAEASAVQGNETILLVEDEEIVRDMATEILRESGYSVIEAKHGPEAITLCQQYRGQIHLMLSDVVMPNMSGRELAERLTPARSDMKVLYMSGYTDDAIVHHGVLEEGTAFIAKPFSPDTLSKKVREVLDAH